MQNGDCDSNAKNICTNSREKIFNTSEAERQTDRQTDRQTNNLTDSCSSTKVEKILKLYKIKSTTITKIKSTKKCIIFPK